MKKITNIVKFIFLNFGPLVGFYFINHFWNFKVAVAVSIFLVFAEFFILKFKKLKISSFFYFSSLIIILFGVADLIVQEPFLFKFEATLTNLFFAVFFGLSLFKDKSIVQQFAEAQKRTSADQSEDKRFFFKFFTLIWSSYFTVKAFFYLWINFNSTLSEGFVIRMIVGKVSFWLMMFISIGLPMQIWKIMEVFKLLPSQRKSAKNTEPRVS